MYYARYNPKNFCNSGTAVAFTTKAARDTACRTDGWMAYTRKELAFKLRSDAANYGFAPWSGNVYLGSENVHEEEMREWNCQGEIHQFPDSIWRLDGVATDPVHI